jgi:hypothetical protein
MTTLTVSAILAVLALVVARYLPERRRESRIPRYLRAEEKRAQASFFARNDHLFR